MDNNLTIENPFEAIMRKLIRIEDMLLKIEVPKNHDETPSTTNCLTIQLAVRITGLKKKTIYNLVCKRMIPHSKRGKRLYFDEQELKDWIRKGKRKTMEELGIGQ